MEIVPFAQAPSEGLRLLAELGEELSAQGRTADEGRVRILSENLRGGSLDATLLLGPKDEAIGIAVWRTVPKMGRRSPLVYLVHGYRAPLALRALLTGADAVPPHEGRLFSVAAEIEGFPLELQQGVMLPWSFQQVFRTALRRTTRPLPSDRAPRDLPTPRVLHHGDRAHLTDLWVEAFEGNIDRLFGFHGDIHEDARRSIDGTLEGEWGTWLSQASFGIETQGRLVGASLLTRPDPPRVPLLTDLLVAPGARGHGWGRGLLVRTLETLHALGEEELELNVVEQNRPAFELYTSLGFLPVPGERGSYWVSPERAGVRVQAPVARRR